MSHYCCFLGHTALDIFFIYSNLEGILRLFSASLVIHVGYNAPLKGRHAKRSLSASHSRVQLQFLPAGGGVPGDPRGLQAAAEPADRREPHLARRAGPEERGREDGEAAAAARHRGLSGTRHLWLTPGARSSARPNGTPVGITAASRLIKRRPGPRWDGKGCDAIERLQSIIISFVADNHHCFSAEFVLWFV